jgi:hypothetical protein
MTTPSLRHGMTWNVRLHRWEPAGMVWDARLHRWVPGPEPDPASTSVTESAAAAKRDSDAMVRPSRGPRKCSQRSRRKRWGAGPRAH